MTTFMAGDFDTLLHVPSRGDMVHSALDFATRDFVPPDGEERVDPLARLLDPTFTDVVWDYEHSYVGLLPGALHPKQLEALHHPATHRWLFWGNQVGKLQAVDEPVLTPTGWRAIGRLRIDDEVIAGDGTVTRVVGVYPQGVMPLYRVTFDDGASTLAGDEHLWTVRTPEARFRKPGEQRGDGYTRVAAGYGDWSVLSTRAMREAWGERPTPRKRCTIPVAPPAQLERQGLAIDPYLLGVLLGDGGLTTRGIRLTSADAELIDTVRACLPTDCSLHHITRYDYRINGGATNSLRAALDEYSLMGHGSATKFVPRVFIDNAPDVRLAVLQGLMDTDGTVGKNGAMEFASISRQLAADVVELARSLGGKAKTTTRQTHYTHNGEKKAGKLSYRVRIRLPGVRLFRLERKHARCFDPTSTCDERVLYSIEPEGHGEAVCIAVAHESATYITRDYIVTHNTTVGAVDIALKALGRHPLQKTGRIAMPNQYTAWASALSWELWEKILLPELLTWLPRWRVLDAPAPFKKSTKRDIIILADNGTESRITGKAAEQGPGAYQSARLDDAWMDEEHPEEVYDELQPRLLRRGGRSIATMTPLKGLTYVHGRIYEPVRVGTIDHERHWYSHAGIRDNPSITPAAREEMLAELKHNPSQIAARDEGLFVRPFGSVLPWEPEKHTSAPSEERMILHRVRGAWYGALDLGKWRFAFVFGVANTDGEFLLVDEYFSQGEDADVRAKGMHDLLQSWKVRDIMIPADCADPQGIQELNDAFDRLRSPYRVYAIDGALKARTAGISRVESMLNRGAFTVRKGMAADRTWYYGRKASNMGRPVMGSRWMWEIANWQYPKTAEGKIQKDDPDDATADGADMMDATRYLIMSFFPADAPMKVKVRPTLAERLQKELEDMDRDEEQHAPGADSRYGGILRQG